MRKLKIKCQTVFVKAVYVRKMHFQDPTLLYY